MKRKKINANNIPLCSCKRIPANGPSIATEDGTKARKNSLGHLKNVFEKCESAPIVYGFTCNFFLRT